MIDEHFMRDWNETHDAFSAGVTRMAAKFRAHDACTTPVGGSELRYQQANRIFVAIVAGVLAGVVAASAIATVDPATRPTVAAVHPVA